MQFDKNTLKIFKEQLEQNRKLPEKITNLKLETPKKKEQN